LYLIVDQKKRMMILAKDDIGTGEKYVIKLIPSRDSEGWITPKPASDLSRKKSKLCGRQHDLEEQPRKWAITGK
jgi:hypothetical protein